MAVDSNSPDSLDGPDPRRAAVSRRRAMQAGAAGAGALWIAPTVMGMATPAAATSVLCDPVIWPFDTGADEDGTNLIEFPAVGPGVVVLVVTSRDPLVDPVVDPPLPNLWTELQVTGTSQVGSLAYSGFLGSSETISITWNASFPERAAAILACYPSSCATNPAVAVNLELGSGMGSSNTLGPTNAYGLATPDKRLIFLGSHGFRKPAPSNPYPVTLPEPGWINQTSVATAATNHWGQNVGAFFADLQGPVADQGPVTANYNDGLDRNWVAGVVAIS